MSTSPVNTRYFMPFERNPCFVGRSAILETIKQAFGHSKITATRHSRVSLIGLGGVGKTEIAIAFAHWIGNTVFDTSIFWVDASSQDSICHAFTSIAEACQIPERDSHQSKLPALVCSWLEKREHGRWVMIIDNAQVANEDLLYLPDCMHGSILITTQDKQKAIEFSIGKPLLIEVNAMSETESGELLHKMLDVEISEEETASLSARLGHLPLGIVQMAGYIRTSQVSISEVLHFLDERDETYINQLRPWDVERIAESYNPRHSWTVDPSHEAATKLDPGILESCTVAEYLALGSDSGYGTMPPPVSVEAARRDNDADSVVSVLTDGTEIHLPIGEEDDLISAFVRDLRQDIGLPMPHHGAAIDDLIMSRLPSLLRTFTLRLERQTRSDMENKAKRFIRQKRGNISKHLRRDTLEANLEEHASSDEYQMELRQESGMSITEKLSMAGWDSEDNFEELPDSFMEENDDPEWDHDPELYRQVRPFLVGGTAYRWLVQNVRSSFVLTKRTGTAVDQIVRKMGEVILSMRQRRSRSFQEFEAEFRIDWDLCTFLESQEYGAVLEEADVFENIITLTGTTVDAQALACKEYMIQTWPSSGHKVIALIRNALQSTDHTQGCVLDDGTKLKISLKPAGHRAGSTLVTASGGEAALTELCEELAWLGASLRPSPISFGACVATPRVDVWKESSGSRSRILIDMSFTMTASTEHETSTQKDGTCWHSMFRNPVVVDGFPIPIRLHDERGLEIPFELMTTLAETDFATYWDETFLLKGASTMLVPTWINYPETIVWHFLFNPQGQRMPHYAFKTHCQAISGTSISWSDVGHMRNFVGWAAHITRHSGTKDIKYENISYTFATPLGAGVAVEKKLTISGSKYIGASFALVRGKRDKPLFVQYSGFDQHIRNAREMSVVLYDGNAERGWLVDGASALLCLVRAQVAQRRQSPSFDESLFDEVAFPHPAEDAGPDAAKNILLDNNTLKLVIRKRFISYETSSEKETASKTEPPSTGAEESAETARIDGQVSSDPVETTKVKYETTTIRDLIADAWGALEQIQNLREEISTDHTTAQLPDVDLESIRRLFRDNKTLKGYQFQDIVRGQSRMTLRTKLLSSNGTKWVDFTNQINSIILFGNDFGEIYKPTKAVHLCNDWMVVPPGCEYLVVPISLLKEIKKRNHEGGLVRQESHEIAQGFALHGPKDIFRLCGSSCQHTFHRVLNFKDGNKVALSSFTGNDGAVLLGGTSLLTIGQHRGQSTLEATLDDDHDSGIGSSRQDHSESNFAESSSQQHSKELHPAHSTSSPILSGSKGHFPNEAKPSINSFDPSPPLGARDTGQQKSEEETIRTSAKEDIRRKEPPTQNQELDQPVLSQVLALGSSMDAKVKGKQDVTQAKTHSEPVRMSLLGLNSRTDTSKTQRKRSEEEAQDVRSGNPEGRNAAVEAQIQSRRKGRFRARFSKVVRFIRGSLTRKPR